MPLTPRILGGLTCVYRATLPMWPSVLPLPAPTRSP